MNRVRITAARKLLTVFTLALSISACYPQAERLRTGDLLFVGTSEEAGAMDEAIVAATGNPTTWLSCPTMKPTTVRNWSVTPTAGRTEAIFSTPRR